MTFVTRAIGERLRPRLDTAPGQEAEAVRERFRELTGYDLEVE